MLLLEVLFYSYTTFISQLCQVITGNMSSRSSTVSDTSEKSLPSALGSKTVRYQKKIVFRDPPIGRNIPFIYSQQSLHEVLYLKFKRLLIKLELD